MDEHVGASFGLSVLIVVAAAVLLTRSPSPRTAAEIPGPRAPNRPEPPNSDASPDSPPPSKAESPPSKSSRVPKTEPARPAPRSPFTRVLPDETLDDVARRVYGPGANRLALWRANRDQLPTAETPVTPGMLLRTPTPIEETR